MRIENLSEVAALCKLRDETLSTRKFASEADKVDARINNIPTPEGVMPTEAVRAAVVDWCTRSLIEIERRLDELGVRVDNREPQATDRVEDLKRSCEMLWKAWSRELGPRRPKQHLIDELVCGTKDLRGDVNEALELATRVLRTEFLGAIAFTIHRTPDSRSDLHARMARLLFKHGRLAIEKDDRDHLIGSWPKSPV